MKINKQQKAALESYARSVLGAVVAVVVTGSYMPKDLLKALLAAALPPLVRWLNPNDKAFGRTK